MKYEHSSKKLDFLLHFGASSLVWFIYLPIVAIIATQVSPLWRYKLLLGMRTKNAWPRARRRRGHEERLTVLLSAQESQTRPIVWATV